MRASTRGEPEDHDHRTLRGRGASVAALISLVALTFAACGGDDDTDEPSALDPDADLSKQTVVVTNWAGYMPPDIAEIVEQETGAKVEITEHATNEDMVAKVVGSGGEGLDVVFGSQPYLQAFAEEGLLEPLDTDYLENWDQLDTEAQGLAEVDDQPYFAPYTWGTTGICYRSDLVDEAPTSWYDLLQPEEQYRGKITMMGTERWAVLPAQKALGYSVNTTDEGEMEDVKELMLDAKPHLLAYDDTTFYERLISGEAVMVEAWDGWCNYGIAENPKIDRGARGGLGPVGRRHRDPEVLGEQGGGVRLHRHDPRPEEPRLGVENILYNVPNVPAISLLPRSSPSSTRPSAPVARRCSRARTWSTSATRPRSTTGSSPR